MAQRCLFSCLALMGCMLLPAAWGQEMARVVSTTPVIQTVSVTEPSCTSAGTTPALCGQVTSLQNRITHYNVVYEYGGKTYSAALAQDPGHWLPIQVTPVVEAPPPTPPHHCVDERSAAAPTGGDGTLSLCVCAGLSALSLFCPFRLLWGAWFPPLALRSQTTCHLCG